MKKLIKICLKIFFGIEEKSTPFNYMERVFSGRRSDKSDPAVIGKKLGAGSNAEFALQMYAEFPSAFAETEGEIAQGCKSGMCDA